MKRILIYSVIFLLTATLLISSFLAVAMIPRNLIHDNVQKSAQYLSEKPGAFPMTVPGLQSSAMDYYADAVLMDIAWYLDPEHPAESISWAKYYTENRYNWNGFVKEYFLKGIQKELPANQQYLRYWHGSIIFVKPLLVLGDIRIIHVVHGMLIAILMLWLILLLFRQKMRTEAVAFIISMITVSIWFVPFCMEFVWMFLCMLVTSIITVKWMIRGNEKRLPALFLITGMVSVFLDFFTTETLTLTIPLLLMIRIRRRNSQREGMLQSVVINSFLWGIGYVGMWMLKWGFAAVCLHQNIMPFVRDSVGEHLRTLPQMNLLEMKISTIYKNMRLLFPLEYGLIGQILILALIAGLLVYPVVSGRIQLRQSIRYDWIGLYFAAGLIPIVRYIVIANHSWVHCFFTYRALAATVMAGCLMMAEVIEYRNTTLRKAVTDNA